MKHYELEISQFVDNELPAAGQKELFAHLSGCEKCRNTLSDFMEIKKESGEFYENIDVELNPAIKLTAVAGSKKERNIYKSLFYFSAAASIIFGMLFFMKLSDTHKLKTEYSLLKGKYNGLTTLYKNLQNKIEVNRISSNEQENANVKKVLPEIEYRREKPNKNKVGLLAVNKSVKNGPSQVSKNNSFKLLQKSRQIRVVQVTKNDFLTPQIIGN